MPLAPTEVKLMRRHIDEYAYRRTWMNQTLHNIFCWWLKQTGGKMTNFHYNLLARAIDIIGFLALTIVPTILFFNDVFWWLPAILLVAGGLVWTQLNYKKDLQQVLVNIANLIICFCIMLTCTNVMMGFVLTSPIEFTMNLYYATIPFSVTVGLILTMLLYARIGLMIKAHDCWPDFEL